MLFDSLSAHIYYIIGTEPHNYLLYCAIRMELNYELVTIQIPSHACVDNLKYCMLSIQNIILVSTVHKFLKNRVDEIGTYLKI